MDSVPAVIRDLEDRETALLSLVENIQRESLHFLEEAAAYRRLTEQFGSTQSQLAESLGKSQSAVANKIRLLALAADTQEAIMSRDMVSERHARALFGLPAERQKEGVALIERHCWTVKQTEDWARSPETQGGTMVRVFKGFRIFLNSFRQAVSTLRQSGVRAEIEERELDDRYEIVVSVPKTENLKARSRRQRRRS